MTSKTCEAQAMLATLILFTFTAWSSLGQDSHLIEEMTLHPSTTLRVQTVAEVSKVIKNPARKTQIEYIVPEGARVEKDELIARFDMTLSLEDLKQALNEAETMRLTYSNEVAKIAENLLKLENNLAEVNDELKVLNAQLDYQESLPLKDELAISHGRLEVARKNAEAERKELERARERFSREMISPRAVKKAERTAARTDALLTHAENEYELAGLSAGSNTIRILELKIENAELKKSRLKQELTKRAEIASINREASKIESELRQQRVDDLIEDTSHTNLYAEKAGTVLYTSRFKRHLMGGSKANKNEGLLEFPDLGTLILKGALRDDQRGFFQPGDPVSIHLNSIRDQKFTGRVKQISPLPRDLTEVSSKLWGENDNDSGIKVFDLHIKFENGIPENIPLGVYGTAQVRTEEALVAPVVPLSFVKTTDQGFYLSQKGTFRPVDGRVMQGLLVLDDKEWLGKTIQASGTFNTSDQEKLPIRTDKLVSSGELTPLNSEIIRSSRMRIWGLKINTLISENSHVNEGDILAVLESEELDKRVKDIESRLTSARSKRQSGEEKMAIETKNKEIGLKRENNLLEIKEREKLITDGGNDYTALNKHELDLQQATTELRYLRDELIWAEERPDNFASAELERMRRDVRRQELKTETAQLRLEKQQRGSTPMQRAKAIHDVAIQKAIVAEMTHDFGLASFQAKRALRKFAKIERQLEQNLKKTKGYVDNLTVRSTASGLVKFERIWDGIGLSKIKVGFGVWPGAQLMSVSNTDRMFVRIPIPEHYFAQVTHDMPVDVLIPSVSQEKFRGRITDIEFMLSPREQGKTDVGLYGSHEPTGSQVFLAHVTLDQGVKADLKAGATAHVIFPFNQ